MIVNEKKLLSLISLILIRTTATTGIFCYQCTSNNSLADCRGKQMVVNCTFPQNHCYRSNVSEGNARAFFQGCISSDQCIDRNEVALKCCAEDLCNGVCQDDPYYADNCSRKASVENYCHDQETFMREHCPKSCNFCKGDIRQVRGTDYGLKDPTVKPTKKATHKATHGLTESASDGTSTEGKSAVFDLKIVYYVLSSVAFALLLCFAVVVWCYRNPYRMKRVVLKHHESIPTEKSELTELREETNNEGTLVEIREESEMETEGHVTGVREDPNNTCLSVSVKPLPDND